MRGMSTVIDEITWPLADGRKSVLNRFSNALHFVSKSKMTTRSPRDYLRPATRDRKLEERASISEIPVHVFKYSYTVNAT